MSLFSKSQYSGSQHGRAVSLGVAVLGSGHGSGCGAALHCPEHHLAQFWMVPRALQQPGNAHTPRVCQHLPVPGEQWSCGGCFGHRLTLLPVDPARIVLTPTAFVHRSRKGSAGPEPLAGDCQKGGRNPWGLGSFWKVLPSAPTASGGCWSSIFIFTFFIYFPAAFYHVFRDRQFQMRLWF